jgi:hypothetical protein
MPFLPGRIGFAVLALLSFLIQTVSLLLQFSRLDGASRLSRSAFEGMLTVHLALLAFLLVSFQDQTLQGSAALTAHAAVRWAGVPTALAGICAAVPEKRRSPVLISALFSAATLPCSDVLFGRDFAWVFMACVLFFLLRGIAGLLSGLRHLKNNLSRLSLKEAVDTLHGGVLFAAAGGRIVLQNRSMLALIHRITGRSASNANELWALLRSPVDAGSGPVRRSVSRSGPFADAAGSFPENDRGVPPHVYPDLRRRRHRNGPGHAGSCGCHGRARAHGRQAAVRP